MSCCQNKSANWICGNIILSTAVCGTYFAGSDTILVFKFFHGVFGGGTWLAMPKTTLHAGLIIIESLVQGLLRESFIKWVNIKRPLCSHLGLAYNLGVLDAVGLPTTVLMRIS